MNINHRYFRLAKRLTTLSDHHTHKHGCLVVRHSKILSTGYNQLKTHPCSNHAFNQLHAEINALRTIKNKNSLCKSVVYLYRNRKNGKPGLSKPCSSCEAALRNAGIKKVYYTTDTYPYWDMYYL